jgi:hypothetical protein
MRTMFHQQEGLRHIGPAHLAGKGSRKQERKHSEQ